jgi:hypothetical protein
MALRRIDEFIVHSILLCVGGIVDRFCARVQTLLFAPAFQRLMLALLKGAQRHWFPRELYSSNSLWVFYRQEKESSRGK